MISTLMPLDAYPAAPPDTQASRNASILSRFSSPLTKRARNVFEVAIEPDDRFKVYGPGEIVKGQVVLSVLKGFDITHLVVALHGFAKVFKHQQEELGSISELVNGKGSRGFEYRGNGLASLFQDEQILCGSGFLKKQVYKFGFELQFPLKGLPSTIDFERGTVTYMISATVTRPTTITPTITKTERITFRDSIDIEPMYTPKVRVISMEPINRRGKMKKVKTGSSVSTQDTSSRKALSRHNTQNSLLSNSATPMNPPLSPAPSVDTVATNATTSTGSYQVVENHSRNHSPIHKASPQTSDTRSSMTSTSAHTITATTELQRYGALAGDVVPIKVSVVHTKPNVRGVIIATLYRLGRIDMHPVLPLATKGKEKKKEYEDVYPRSRTGLGGLYFANSSPSSVFRKDLSQSSTMMIVDPHTLTADVRTSLKVPKDAFPSIGNVPGGMISFTYHVEVVLDLNGKLGETRFLPSLTSNGPTFSTGTDNGNQISTDWAHSILDTTSLRRNKHVVTFELPLVVGTKDGRRLRPMQDSKHLDTQYHVPNGKFYAHDAYPANSYYEYAGYEAYGGQEGYEGYDGYGEYEGYEGYEGCYYDEYGNLIYDEYYDPAYQNGYNNITADDSRNAPPPALIPPPSQENGEIDEKTRLRRQEELLMPSQPPEVGEASIGTHNQIPSAPSFDQADGLGAPLDRATVLRPTITPTVSRASGRSTETIVPTDASPPPSLPSTQHIPQTEDKQELERQRLLAQASAPPEGSGQPSSSNAPVPSAPLATAPVLDDDEEYLSRVLQQEHLSADHLPQYQR